MKELILKGLSIEQLEERMEFTTMGLDLTPDQIAAAHEVGYTDADLAAKPGSKCYPMGSGISIK